MRRLLLAALLLPVPALAQDVDCAAPRAQAEMTFCAGAAFERADAALNDAYGEAIDLAATIGLGTELRDAQRLWIAFRDAACEVEGLLYQGGTGEPMVRSMCLERVTLARLADLRAFVDTAPRGDASLGP